MGATLEEIAQKLHDTNKKVQLIYAFNGTGKTRLSRAFKRLVAPKNGGEDGEELGELSRTKILYYNAFTEDLFYWDNDLEDDVDPKLKIQKNSFTDWILKEQGQDQNVISNFQRYADNKLMPKFGEKFDEVTFSLESGDDEHSGNLKISKGEESNFIWSIFYTLLDQVINILNVPEPEDRESDQFNHLQYVFIDDPVSSLDENNLIELAVNLAGLITSCSFQSLKFIVTTHNPLFFNVLFNELKNKTCYQLDRSEDGTFDLIERKGDSNRNFSYHLHLIQILEQAIGENRVEKFHFTLLRNLYEKTASFLGYPKWSELLPDDKQTYLNRIIQFTSHNTLSSEAIAGPTPQEKQTVKFLLDHLRKNYSYWQSEELNG